MAVVLHFLWDQHSLSDKSDLLQVSRHAPALIFDVVDGKDGPSVLSAQFVCRCLDLELCHLFVCQSWMGIDVRICFFRIQL